MTTLTRSLVAFIVLTLAASPTFADLDYAVKLKTRTFIPDAVTSVSVRAASLQDKHILVQFTGPITDDDRARLAGDGVEILEYIPDFTYTARLNRSIDQSVLDRYDIRWFDGIQPVDKISPMISELGIGEWARRGDNLVQFTVVIHADEDQNAWATRFENDFDAQIIGFDPTTNAIDLILPEPAYYRLSEIDAVVWIEQAAPPPEEHNNSCRDNTGSGTLQELPYGLTGAGVKVAEWDGGIADQSHPDLMGRVTLGDNTSIGEHATHVAGTVLGSGANSGGTYRGMAPQANLMTFLWWGSTSEIVEEYSSAIDFWGADISTNSWGTGVGDPATQSACQSTMGNYFTSCATLDNTVRGELSDPIVIVWSAGNQRGSSSSYCGSIGWTFNTVSPYGTAKNLITVGAINSNSSTMTSFSSWGPCDDGRIKPDVVGPGCQSSGDFSVTSTVPGGGYGGMCGTSMSAPAVAGTVALLVEQFQTTFFAQTLLPSTYKGILINTAEDLGNVGPDYSFGHGKVDGVAAAEKIATGEPSYFESEIGTGIVHTYDLTVPSGATKLKATLVWDDPGGTASASQTLINDLDLVLIDPFTLEEQPWVLDDELPALPATKGTDRTNNVETVEIDNPSPGLWKARVSGYNIPDGPQKYSLVFTPDSIYTPGNLAALAIFDEDDITDDPGASVVTGFWVTNVGANRDSINVTISDDNLWLIQSIDTILTLDPWDSVYLAVTADIPSNSLAGDSDSIMCAGVSLLNAGVSVDAIVKVTAGAYYGLTVASPTDEISSSPDVIDFDFSVNSQGNANDNVTITLSSALGWTVSPGYTSLVLAPFGDTLLSGSVSVPAEIEDQVTDTILIFASSSGGVYHSESFLLTVVNPYLPPTLMLPETDFYTQQRALNFEWDGTGDSSTLYIATDTDMSNVVRTYSRLTSNQFAMPTADSLDDGRFYWAVRQYFGATATSLQAQPGSFVVDNAAPGSLILTSPLEGEYVRFKQFSFKFGYARDGVDTQEAPEYNIVQICQQADFASGVVTYEPISSLTYMIPDSIAEGRWWWRAQRADSAGNIGTLTSSVSFLLDSEAPPIPTQLEPVDDSNVKNDVTLKWTRGGALPPQEITPEYYRLQMYDGDYNMMLDSLVYADSATLGMALFENGFPYGWRVQGRDSSGNSSLYQSSPFFFNYLEYACGDVDGGGDGQTISDLTFLVDYLFASGPAPDPLIAGSVDCNDIIDISDLTYYVEFLFNGGPPPCCQ
jgi:hypothetical protein